MTDRKKPGWLFWTTVMVVVVLVAYPLSIRPVHWTCYQLDSPDWVWTVLHYVYASLYHAVSYGPDWLNGWFWEYSLSG